MGVNSELVYFQWQLQQIRGMDAQENQKKKLMTLLDGIRDGSLTIEDVLSYTNLTRNEIEEMLLQYT